MNRTGLAMETAAMASDKSGVRVLSRNVGGVGITDVRVSETAQRLGKPAGRYITLEGEPDAQSMTALLKRAIEQVIPRQGRLFAAGLGNPDITQDSLGALSVRSMAAGKGARYSLAAIETDIAVRTGIDTVRLVRSAANEIGADCVIAVDSLACRDPRLIGRTVQISDTGIVPGSGASGSRRELSERTVGIPVAVIGVPTVTELSSVTRSDRDNGFLITTGDIDITVKLWAETVAAAVNGIVR
ncbi:MAG: GPR endopeptidase [Oscillospiraceae bacterium]|nr:GPR endopeptidase [Oscillospiraceae bacterium]